MLGRIDTRTSEYCLNVFMALDGTLHPTPFEMPRKGMWYFDGQIFYQRRK